MPVWNEETLNWVREGKLVVLGIAQEHHPDRCRLFAQWKELGWPIVYDPINLMSVRAVPREVAVDENGIVRGVGVKAETLGADFVDRAFGYESAAEAVKAASPPLSPDIAVLRSCAESSTSCKAWRELGDALVLWGGIEKIGEAITAYEKVIEIEPDDGRLHFRLGVCYRMRYESELREDGDFQAAVACWSRAREISPNQYIWRRRLEQYGPRLTKPYAFYDWVETAARQIRARGEQPVELTIAPGTSERATPEQEFEAEVAVMEPPDPDGRIRRDAQGLVKVEVTVVPPRVKAGDVARVYVTLAPNDKLRAHWNNDAPPMRLWIDQPRGWKVQPQLLVGPGADDADSSQVRQFEFETQLPAKAKGAAKLEAYALYYVCEDVASACHFLRQDITIDMAVDGQ